MKREKSARRLFESVSAVYLILMVTAFLLWPGAAGYISISSAKFTLFLILCGGYAGLMILLHIEETLIGGMELPSPGKLWKGSSWTQRLVLLYLLLTWISALLSPHWPDTVLGVSRNEGALTITLYCLCFLFLSVYARVRPWMLSVLAAALLLFDVLCLVQMMGGNPFGLYPEGMNYFDANVRYSGAYLGTIGNVDHVASFLCVAVPLLWTALLRVKGRQRILWAVTLAVTLVVLLRMWVLAALVGVVLGGTLALPVALPASDHCRRWVAAAAAAVLLLCLAGVYLFDFGSGMLHELHELLRGRGQDSFGSGRLYIWRSVLKLVPERLWLGYGPDTMLLAGIEPFTRVDEALGTVIRARIDTAHNEYLNILFHQGLPALLAYVGALIAAAVKWIRRRNDTVAACAGAAVLCYCVQALFGISVCITAPYFWLALALLDSRKSK